MKRVLNYIGSRKFAVYLLVLTTFLMLFANLLPNISFMEPEEVDRLLKERPALYALSSMFAADRIASNPFFLLLPIFLFTSISVCTLKRIDAMRKSRLKSGLLPAKPKISYKIVVKKGPLLIEEIISIFKRNKWNVEKGEAEPEVIIGRKGDYGFYGSVLFHLGMDVVFIGLLFSLLAGVSGYITLTEGFTVDMPAGIKTGAGRKVEDFPLGKIYLKLFKPSFEEGKFHVDYSVDFSGMDRSGLVRDYNLRVNKPVKLNGYNVVFSKAGYAPHFILKDKDGELLDDSIVNMKIMMPGKPDSYMISDEALSIDVELFPDYYMDGDSHMTKSDVPNNPVLYVKIKKWDKVIGGGFLHLGDEVKFDNYLIEFSELRHWVKLGLSRDPGMPAILIGFIMIVVGLIVRFVLNDRRVWLIMNSSESGLELGLGGRSGYFPAMFDEELKALSEEIKLKLNPEIKGLTDDKY